MGRWRRKALSLKESDERGAREASLVQVMDKQEDTEMEKETYVLCGERNRMSEQYFPSKIQIAMEDDMLMLATEVEEINQMLASVPLEEDDLALYE